MIINQGDVVAAGDVDALRDRHAGRRVRVELDGVDDPGWAQGLEGVRVVEADGGRCLLELGPGADDQRLLYAAQIAGRLRSFGPERPSLTDLFRDALE